MKFFGGKPVPYETVEEHGWQPNIDDLESKISNSTRALIIINQNNPTGALYDQNLIKRIVDLADELNLLVISDEIYDRIVFKKGFVSAARVAKDVPVVGMNGFSKTYLMTGWRLGYMYFHDPEGNLADLKECVAKQTRIRLSANAPVQKAGAATLRGPQHHIQEITENLQLRRDYAVEGSIISTE